MHGAGAADSTSEVEWSVHVTDVATGEVLLDRDGDVVLPCASIGKVLVLIEAARRLEAGTLDPDELLERTPGDTVRDSGIWQDLRTHALPAADACALIGAVSDNLATNVVVRALGLEAIGATATAYGLGDVTLHDLVREERGPDRPPYLATASARSLARLFARLYRDEIGSPPVSATVRAWLAANTDLSMVPASWGLDPLAHRPGDAPRLALVGKTGTDIGVRADAGVVSSAERTLAYAVIARWDPKASELERRSPSHLPVLARMVDIGREIADELLRPPSPRAAAP